MSDFGDFEEEDAFDPSPADPEQVARRLQKYRRDVEPELPSWDDLGEDDRARAVAVIVLLLAWLRRSGSLR